ncbi:MAG: UDP-N-acetylmuramate--alanine ligase [Lentisphaerae bacterium]|nr:UDP-N-acetylmuramate--alanine ligase [Lentisphaerota bacterium]
MNEAQHSHVVGVAGIGMSALAQLLLARGDRVTGSDRCRDDGDSSEICSALAAAGVELVPQDGAAITPATARVIHSTAIEADNPALLAAQRHGVAVQHRSDVLAACLEGKHVVAITGTSGKSTVTGMIGWVFQELGLDPTVVNGAIVPAWRAANRVGNVRMGASNLWVIEADESDRTLNAYTFDWGVVTNVSEDHFGVDEARALFRLFARRAAVGAVSVVDDPVLMDGFDPEVHAGSSTFCYADHAFTIPLPGRHNGANAWLAVRLCERMGCPLDRVALALASFPGLHRRLECVGKARGIRVFDDYAHNPAKITAAWQAVRQGGGRVLAVWRPHGYGPLRLMMEALSETFNALCGDGDRLVLLPVFDAGGTADRSVSSEMLVERMRETGTAPALVLEPAALPAWIAAEAREGDSLLVMGARDPGLPALAAALLAAL